MPTHYDAIVIGTGQAGPSLAARLANAGRSTAVIERARFGGTCVNSGCTPTKTLVASARAMHVARRGAEFGFSTGGDVRVDMTRVKARMLEVVRQSNSGVERWMTSTPGLTAYRGHARLTGARTVRVDGQDLDADEIFLNVGARAVLPAIPGADTVSLLTNSSLLALDTLPEHLVILGGSYIGLEFAQIYRRFGSRVTVVERGPRLIPREDEDVSQTLLEILRAEGIDVLLSAEAAALEALPAGARLTVRTDQGSSAIEGSHILAAVGRRPNTDDLGLETAGVALDGRGFIVVDDQCRTSVPGIWALGECNGRGAFTHTAYHDFEIVAGTRLDGHERRITDRIPCYALYTDPPVGRVGMTLAEARASGRRILVGERPMTKVSRAREMGETLGFMRALVDADTKQLLGAVVFGPGGDEVVHSLLDVMYAGAPYTTISRAVHVHPTISELVPTMLQELRPLAS
jgi:pyruvate/2-oxoglutarate dehydrogenase complex dihydrolipoamide dehydrogenase (E3) component